MGLDTENSSKNNSLPEDFLKGNYPTDLEIEFRGRYKSSKVYIFCLVVAFLALIASVTSVILYMLF